MSDIYYVYSGEDIFKIKSSSILSSSWTHCTTTSNNSLSEALLQQIPDLLLKLPTFESTTHTPQPSIHKSSNYVLCLPILPDLTNTPVKKKIFMKMIFDKFYDENRKL